MEASGKLLEGSRVRFTAERTDPGRVEAIVEAERDRASSVGHRLLHGSAEGVVLDPTLSNVADNPEPHWLRFTAAVTGLAHRVVFGSLPVPGK